MAGFKAYFVVGSALALALCGCTTPEEKQAAAARRAAPTAVVVKPETGQPIGENTTPHSTDGFPTFNAPLTAANVQLSDQQAGDAQKQLTALAASKQAGTITEAEYEKRVAEMRKLAAEHGSDTLSQIEK